MRQFFEKRGYPVSVVKAGHHRAQQFDQQSSRFYVFVSTKEISIITKEVKVKK